MSILFVWVVVAGTTKFWILAIVALHHTHMAILRVTRETRFESLF
jgi:hypothetical protein